MLTLIAPCLSSSFRLSSLGQEDNSDNCEVDPSDNSTCTYSNIMDSYDFHRDLLKVNASDVEEIKKIIFINSFMDNIPKELSGAYKNLEYLEVSKTHLERLENYDFIAGNKIISLNASNNKIHKLGARMVSNIRNIVSLDLSHNIVERLNPTAFNYNPKFKFLNLSHNRISMLDKSFLEPLRSLEVLKLDHNLITNIDGDFSDSNLKWKELYLQHNKLMALDPSLIKAVSTLDVSLNNIESAPYENTKLIELVISNNKLKSLSISDSLNKLDASDNKLNVFDISFGKNDALTYLDLSDSKLIAPEKTMHYIRKLKKLEYLDLSDIQATFEESTFRGLDSLKTLILSSALWNQNRPPAFKDLSKLDKLDLSENVLYSFDFNELKNSKNLVTLNLRNSFICVLTGWKNISATFPKLKEIDIYHNKIHCDELPEIIKEFLQHGVTIIDYYDMGETRFLHETCVDSKTHEELVPRAHGKSYALIYVLGIFILCAVVVAVLFLNRKFGVTSSLVTCVRREQSSHGELLRDDM